jgi:hypothetical protein
MGRSTSRAAAFNRRDGTDEADTAPGLCPGPARSVQCDARAPRAAAPLSAPRTTTSARSCCRPHVLDTPTGTYRTHPGRLPRQKPLTGIPGRRASIQRAHLGGMAARRRRRSAWRSSIHQSSPCESGGVLGGHRGSTGYDDDPVSIRSRRASPSDARQWSGRGSFHSRVSSCTSTASL